VDVDLDANVVAVVSVAVVVDGHDYVSDYV
jgi:hypothetical protein